MKQIVGDSYDEIMNQACSFILESGETINNTREVLGAILHLNFPCNRYPVNIHRKHNIFALTAETIWVITGHNNIEWLERFLPRAKDYSDDYDKNTGKGHWRAGYGKRIRDFNGVDQVNSIYNLLKEKSSSRQAVISIWDPNSDTDLLENCKDIPCNNWLHFIIRNGFLNLHVAIRSNDMIWGNLVNTFVWSTLQEILASSLRLEIGYLRIYPTSLHIYENHLDRAKRIADFKSKTNLLPSRFESLESLEDALKVLEIIYEIEKSLQSLSKEKSEEAKNSLHHSTENWSFYLNKYPIFTASMSIPLFYNREKNEHGNFFKENILEIKIDPHLMRNVVGLENGEK